MLQQQTRIAILFYLVFLFISSSWNTINAQETKTNNCQLPITSRLLLTRQYPLVFSSKGELYETTPAADANKHHHVIVENDIEVLLSCGPNYLKNVPNKMQYLRVICNGTSGNFIYVNSAENAIHEKGVNELTCDLRVIEQVIHPVEGCDHADWTSTQFGYVHPTQQTTYIVGEACYDTIVGQTIFAHVKLGDKSGNYLKQTSADFLSTHKHPSSSYKIEFFRALHFDEIYKRFEQLSPYLSKANFVDETFLSSIQFQAVKKLNWNYYIAHDSQLATLEALKMSIRNLSQRLNVDIYVGSHGVYTLHNQANGNLAPVYLQETPKKRFPMPMVIWIVVKAEHKATAFALYNPSKGAASTSPICISACGKISWLDLSTSGNSNNIACCSYADLKSAINTLPQWNDVKDMLL